MGTTFESTKARARAGVNPEIPAGGNRAGALFRIYMGGNAMLSLYIAMMEARSLMYLVAQQIEGEVLIWLLGLAGLAAVLDGVINDLLPDRYHWRVALRQRHFILVCLAFCYVAQLYVAFFKLRSTGLLGYYLWNALIIMAVAFFDAHQRSKDASCVIICN